MQLNVMPLSELLTTANNYAASIKELGIYSDLVKELCIRLDAGSIARREITKQRDALAAENAALKSALAGVIDRSNEPGYQSVGMGCGVEGSGLQTDGYGGCEYGWREAMERIYSEVIPQNVPETPATDAFIAEVRAQARSEGINYAASRLAAAFNHGFVDKPVKEVADVVRMILTAKEDLANDPLPAPDALSGEYAEQALEEFAAQLRKGGAA